MYYFYDMFHGRQFRKGVRSVVVAISALAFVISLILPYSSNYYARDSRVSLADQRSNKEKVEVSTALLESPLECLNTKVIQEHLSVERIAITLHRAFSATLHDVREATNAGYRSRILARVPTWRPSLCIVQRKLII